MVTGSIQDSLLPLSAATSIATGPSSTMEVEPPLPISGVLHVTMSTSDINIIGTTLDNIATKLDAGASDANLVAPIV